MFEKKEKSLEDKDIQFDTIRYFTIQDGADMKFIKVVGAGTNHESIYINHTGF